MRDAKLRDVAGETVAGFMFYGLDLGGVGGTVKKNRKAVSPDSRWFGFMEERIACVYSDEQEACIALSQRRVEGIVPVHADFMSSRQRLDATELADCLTRTLHDCVECACGRG